MWVGQKYQEVSVFTIWGYGLINMSLKSHITKKCTTAMLSFQKIKLIRRYLTKDAATTLVLGLVISHLDYCNSILYGLPDCDINKFQRIQNMSAKLVLKCKKSDSATQCLKDLHWLPIRERIIFKMLTLTYKCLHGQAPHHLKTYWYCTQTEDNWDPQRCLIDL